MNAEAPTLVLGLLSASTVLISLYVGSQVRLVVGQLKSQDVRIGRIEGILMNGGKKWT